MTLRVRPLGLLFILLASTALLPITALASSAPAPRVAPTVAAAPCAGPLAALTEISNVSAIAPSRVDVLANDCVGVATPSRPLRITAVGQGTYGSVSTDGASVTYDPRGCATGDADGNDLFSYTITDGTGTKSGFAVVHVVRPAASPLTDLPQAGFVAGSTIGSSVPLRVSWCGVTASGSGVRSYRLLQGTNGGSTFPTVITAATTSTSSTRNATPNTSYAWRVRTTDSKGRAGGYATSLASKVTVVQNSSSSIAYSSGWSTTSGAKYSGGSERYTSKAGATATLTVTNVRAIAIVASKGAGRGSFNVYVDGVKVTASAISERAAVAVTRRVLVVRGLTSGSGVRHAVQVRAVGNGRVDLDAILTLSGKRDQAITFAAAPTAARYHGPTYAAAATASSGLPVSLSVNQASWTVCSLSGGVVSFLKPGSCRIDASQSGDATWNPRTSSQTFAVAPIALTVTGITAASRTYDGTTAATLATSLAAFGPAQVVAGDVVGLDATGATGSFTDRNAGNGKTVHVAGLVLTGSAAAKYAITQPTTTASISAAGLTVSFSAADRQYDGTTSAGITTCSVAGVVGSDVVTCDHAGATASFADANAGTSKTVTGSGFVLAGLDAGNYVIATVDTTTADIARASQTVAFTSVAPVDPDVGTTYAPTATSTSGLTPAITVDPAAAPVCHLTAGTVTADADGTCILSADQDGDSNHLPAAQVQQAYLVGTGLLAQSISFDLSAVTATYGDAPVAISATATSGLTVGFAPRTSSVCTVTGTNVTIVAAGVCTIRASQAGNGTYAAAPNVDRSFTVALRTITVTAVTDTKVADGTNASDGIPTITAGTLATGDSATWTQSFDTAAAGTGKTLTPTGTILHGVADVTASYDIAFAPVTNGVIQAVGQTISFDLSGVSPTYGDGPVATSASATSGLPVGLASLTTSTCSASGTNVTLVAAGLCTIRASQPGNGTYAAAADVDQSFTVAQRAITVTAVIDVKVADGTTSSDGVPTVTTGSIATGDTATWTQTFDTAAAGTGKTLTPTGNVARGLADVTSSYDITFVAVTTGVIEAVAQTISFDLSSVSATYGDAPVGISATATSGLTVGFASRTTAVCTVTGSSVTIVAAGTCTIRASQPGDGSNAAAPDVDRSFTVDPRAITVTAVTDTKPADGTTASDGVPTITSGSLASGDTAAWTQTFDSATVGTGKTLTPAGTVARGLADVTGSYDITFLPVTTGVIGPGNQAIAFDLSAVTAKYGDAPVTISATATSGLPVTFASLTPTVCTVTGTSVTIATPGTCTIRASQAGNGTWAPAPNVDSLFTVGRRPITVTAVTDTKTADGTTTSSGLPTITTGTLAAGDTATWTQTFDTAAAGTGRTLTPTGTVSHGLVDVTSYYLITFVPNTTGVIGPGPADVTKSTVKASPPNVTANGTDTTTITVRLRTAANVLLIASGGVVTIFADHGTVGPVTDHGDGSYTATYTSDTFAGSVTVTAQLNGQPLVATASITQH